MLVGYYYIIYGVYYFFMVFFDKFSIINMLNLYNQETLIIIFAILFIFVQFNHLIVLIYDISECFFIHFIKNLRKIITNILFSII